MKKVGNTSTPFRYDLNQIPYDYIVKVRNRFKGLDLIYRVPDELWTEVRDTVQETGIKTIPKKKKCKKAKWLSEEALQISVKRREVKSKGYNPAIPLLGIHTEETRIERDTCTPMFIAALFIIARTWKQPRCPSAEEWIRKLWYIYTMEYYSAIKKNIFESVKVESEKVGLKLNIQKTKIMVSGPITSWKIDGETLSDFIFGGSKITVDADCSHEIKRCLLPGRKVMINLDSIFKSRDITLPTKARLVKAMVFPVVMYGCESWTVKKAERRRIDAFELWC